MHGGVIYLKPTNAEKSIAAVANGSAELYYDDSKKAETVSNGFNVFNKLGIGVTVGNSLGNRTYAMARGDNDTGIAQNGDGILEFWSNNQVKGTIAQIALWSNCLTADEASYLYNDGFPINVTDNKHKQVYTPTNKYLDNI